VTGNNASAGGYKIDQSWQLDLKLGITEGTMPSEFTRHELFLHKYLMEKDLLFSDTWVMIEQCSQQTHSILSGYKQMWNLCWWSALLQWCIKLVYKNTPEFPPYLNSCSWREETSTKSNKRCHVLQMNLGQSQTFIALTPVDECATTLELPEQSYQ